MQGNTRWVAGQTVWLLLALGVASLVVLVLVGQLPETVAGWLVTPALVVGPEVRRRAGRRWGNWRRRLAAVWWRLGQSWRPVVVRSLVLWLLWTWCGHAGWAWLAPWGWWLWQGLGVGWPGLRSQAWWRWVGQGLWQGQRLLLVIAGGQAVAQVWAAAGTGWPVLLGCLVGVSAPPGGEDAAPAVHLARQADGSYQAQLRGDFTLRVAGDDPLRLRLLLVLLSQLDVTGSELAPTRHSRRTRDGRTPFVRQQQLAAWLEVPQSCISRWLGYWHAGNWADLLSLHSPAVLTQELQARIVTVCATFPHWRVAQVHEYLRQQAVAVTLAQVQQAVTQSGWQQLQQTLTTRYELGATALRLRDEWLVAQLLAQSQALLDRWETNQPLSPEVRTALADLTTLAAAAGVSTPPSVTTVPWLLRVEQLLFSPWSTGAAPPDPLPGEATVTAPATSLQHDQAVTPAADPGLTVRCPSCGATQVGRKSAKPRYKQYYDEHQQLCQVAVYRYYCHNPQCAKGSFTHLPVGLAPYSRYRTELHLLAVQLYAWGCTTYRRTGAALGVTSLTAWRWTTAWGDALLPVAALFGVVRSSGVVGVDEKYVLVPKNDKPATPMRRWMYVYLAVDVWTCDLLHIALYPHNSQDSAQAFLLALRTKGYHPQVIVTDLRQDYGPSIAQVFPNAVHHECIFHALQNTQRLIKDAYGPGYAEKRPAAAVLKQQIYDLFAVDSQTLAHERYAAVLALRQDYVQATPTAAAIFDFLDRHWPTLANSIGSALIPATNNTVERVIRRFDQHYHHFCGFESSAHAQRYLAVFEKVYRFTPFSQDAQPAIRGRSPLQLAGYDVAACPMTTLCAGLSILWPMPLLPEPVPKS